MTQRILSVILVIVMFIGIGPDLSGLFSTHSYADAQIPEAFHLDEAKQGIEQSSGCWHYVLREDGYAVITGYDGDDADVMVPYVLDGYDVVGIASGALTGRERVKLHVNIFTIDDDAFVSDSAGNRSLPEIVAPNGSYGLWWADHNGYVYSTGKDYELVPGVIDYTDVLDGRVQKRGDSHVAFHQTEALPLKVGSLLFMRDAREMEFFFRVTELTNSEDTVIASVEIPEVADTFINYDTTVEVVMTEKDFIPAEGVTVGETAASGKTISSGNDDNSIPINLEISSVTPKIGNNKSTKCTVTGSVTGTIVNKVTYTLQVRNGEITKAEIIKRDGFELTVSVSDKTTVKLINQLDKAQKGMAKKANGEEPSKEEKGAIEAYLKIGGYQLGVNTDDAEDFEKLENAIEQLLKDREKARTSQKMDGDWDLGEGKIQTPWFNIDIKVKMNFTIEGNITYNYSNTSVTRQHYNFNTDEWEVDDSRDSVGPRETSHSLDVDMTGKFSVIVEFSCGFWVLKNFGIVFEGGIEASMDKHFDLASGGVVLLRDRCTELTLAPFASLSVYLGVWVGDDTGGKFRIYHDDWDSEALIGKPYFLALHINFSLENEPLHAPEDCPFNNMATIHYDTGTDVQIQDQEIPRLSALSSRYNIDLNSNKTICDRKEAGIWKAGEFLGWAWSADDTTPTAVYAPGAGPSEHPTFQNADGTQPVMVSEDITFYAVWMYRATVTFDSAGGSTVRGQTVPRGGYAKEPEAPQKAGKFFFGWLKEDGSYWDFNVDRVEEDVFLTADWGESTALAGGTQNVSFLGDLSEVRDAYRVVPSVVGPSDASYFVYEKMTVGGIETVKITGLKNNPEILVIPTQLPNPSDPTGGLVSKLNVSEITHGAFSNCQSLRSVYFLADDASLMLDTTQLFSGCTNLEYVELPKLESGKVWPQTFQGCSSLVCVKLRTGTETIEANAFRGTALSRLIVPEGITAIGAGAFQNNQRLERISFGHTLTSLGADAFAGCTSLEKLYIPDNITTLGVDSTSYHGPFVNCTGLKEISVGGVRTLTSGMLKTGSTALTKLVIRGSVETIDEQAFDSGQPFDYHTVYTTLRPYNKTTPGSYGGEEYSDYEGGLRGRYYNKAGNGYNDTTPEHCELIVEEGVTTISRYAFAWCNQFTSVSLPASLTVIDTSAFQGCSRLAALERSFGGAKKLGAFAFADCIALDHIDLTGVQTVRNYAFRGCSAAETLYIADSVTTLAVDTTYYRGPFFNCTGLKEISVGGVSTLTSGMLKTGSAILTRLVIRGSVKTIDEQAFDSGYAYDYHTDYTTLRPYNKTTPGSYGGEEYSDYEGYLRGRYYNKAGNGYNDTTSIKCELFIEEGVTTISRYAFAYCKQFTSVSLPSSLNKIDTSAFQGCSRLATLVRDFGGAKKLGARSFEACTSLERINLDGVQTVINFAFSDCSGLKYLEPGSTVTTIREYAFNGCTALEKLIIPDSCTTLGVDTAYYRGPFYNCTGLKEISVGGVSTLKTGMLKTGSTALEKLEIRGSVKTIDEQAFDSGYRYDYHTEYTALRPIGNTSPGYYGGDEYNDGAGYIRARYYNQAGNGYNDTTPTKCELIIENGVTRINRYAFCNCDQFTSVSIPSTVTLIGYCAFSGCGRITDMSICASQVTVQNSAFSGCGAMTVHLMTANAGIAAYLTNNSIPWDSMSDYQNLLLLKFGNGEEDQAQMQGWNEPVTLPVPARADWAFTGWYTNQECSELWTDGVMPNETLILYAGWIPAETCGEFRTENNSVTLLSWVDMTEEGDTVWLPESVKGLPLTGIAKHAFRESRAEQLWISKTVTEIEAEAFAGSRLSSLNVDALNPVFLGEDGILYNAEKTELLFFPSVRRTAFTLPEELTGIGDYAFSGTALESLSVPVGSQLRSIGQRALRDTGITELCLPAGLETIGDRAFSGCENLIRIEAAESPSQIGEYAFAGCNPFLLAYGPDEDCALRTAIQSNGYLYNAYTLTMILPYGTVKTAFLEAGMKLVLPTAPETDENEQFIGWFTDEARETALNSTVMPAQNLTVYAGTGTVFEYETITLPENAGEDEVEPESEAATLKITACHALSADAVIPESIGDVTVASIAAGAFGPEYASVTIPATVTEIEYGAFAEGTILVCVQGSYAVSWAAQNGFETMERLWNLILDTGFGLESETRCLHAGDFIDLEDPERTGYDFDGWYWDEGLSEAMEGTATMPAKNVTVFAGWTLSDADAADAAEYLLWEYDSEDAPEGEDVTEKEEDPTRVIITGYTGTAEELSIPSTLHGKTVVEIADYAFAMQGTLTRLTLPDTITTIGAAAFFAMGKLEQVDLPSGLMNLPEEAFADCSSLSTITLPEGLESISGDAFSGTSLSSLTLPASLKILDNRALHGCNQLETIQILPGNHFYESRNGILVDTADDILVKYPAAKDGSNYVVDSDLVKIGDWAFEGASQLQTVTLGNNIWELGEGAFSGSGLTALPALGNMVTVVPSNCFRGCVGLTEVTVPEGIRKIGKMAFLGVGVQEVTIPASVEEIGILAVNSGTVVIGQAGSFAQSWAEKNNVFFLAVGSVSVESLKLNHDSMNLEKGMRVLLSVTAVPDGADIDGLKYSSSDNTIIRVTQDGAVYAVGLGDAYVYATIPDGTTDLCAVRVRRYDRKLVLPTALGEIDEEAFYGASAEKIVVPGTVTNIGSGAFANSDLLNLAEFATASVAVAPDAFADCPNLSIYAPAGGSLENYAQEHQIPFLAR